jgi:hypothetical protein
MTRHPNVSFVPACLRVRARVAVVALGLLLSGCNSAGRWGFSRVYSPASEEEDSAREAREYDPVMIAREPESFRGAMLSVFGIVTERAQGKGGFAYLTLSMRTLAERNLCESADEQTCRVTVSDREHAVVHASVKLAPGDDIGPESLQVGALVRVIGKLTDNVDGTDGMPVLAASYYRHWPRNYFVTTASAPHMRR